MKRPLLGGSVVAAVLAVRRRRARRALATDPEQAVLTRPLYGRPMAVTSADGTRLHVETFGPGDGPAIVLVHGWTSSLRVWVYQLRELSGTHRVVAYDLRGHGRSDPAAGGDYSADALAADLEAVLRAYVAPDEKAVVVGHSMGAMSIVAWAGAHPDQVEERLAGALLINTGVERLIAEARILITASSLSRLKQAIGRRVLGVSLAGPRRPTAFVRRVVRYVVLGARATPAQAAFCERLFLDCPSDVRAAFGATLSDLDLAHALHALTVPTIIIAGERDRLTPPLHARAIARVLPHGNVVELPEIGHCSLIEAHAEVSARIRELAEPEAVRRG
jgi:pimeloyl-ACP methyl ester carboxylesterase